MTERLGLTQTIERSANPLRMMDRECVSSFLRKSQLVASKVHKRPGLRVPLEEFTSSPNGCY